MQPTHALPKKKNKQQQRKRKARKLLDNVWVLHDAPDHRRWGCSLLANININATATAAATTRTTTTLIAHVGDDAFCGLSHKMQFDGAVQKQFFKLSTNLATAARRTIAPGSQLSKCPRVYDVLCTALLSASCSFHDASKSGHSSAHF